MTNEKEKLLLQDDDIIKTDEGLVFNPYNLNNIEITKKDVETILRNCGLPGIVHNLDLYKRAFVHRSYTKRPMLENEEQNITIKSRPAGCITLKSKSILCEEKKNQIGIVYCCSVTYAARLSKNKLFRAQAAQ